MGAKIGNPCDITTGSVKNTGVECAAALAVAKGLSFVASGLTWNDADEADPVAWHKTQIHARNLFPVLQGIFDFAPTQESDVSESNPITGTTRKLRAGGITMLYTFQDGGLCLAKALKTFEGKGYRVIMYDQEGKMLRRKNADGSYSGLKTNDIASAIIFASASATFKNTVSISVSQDELIKYADLKSVVDGDVTDFNGLIDVEITKAAAPTNTTAAVSATGTYTVTAVGSDNDTINLKVSSVTISGSVIKTSAESTVTLLAAKVVAAINAATSTNGGYTASNTAGVITVTAPSSLGATLNTFSIVATIIGGITGTIGAFAGGVTTVGKIRLGVRTECAHTSLVAIPGYSSTIIDPDLYIFTDKATKAVITPAGLAIVNGNVEVTGPFISGHTYISNGSTPIVWLANNMEGYDASDNSTTEHLMP